MSGKYEKPSFNKEVYEKINNKIKKDIALEEGAGYNTKNQKSSRDEVALLQHNLKYLGYDIGTSGAAKDGVDGLLGEKTKAAIKKFQKDHGLPETGKLDNVTNFAMLAVVEEKYDKFVIHDSKVEKNEHQNSGVLSKALENAREQIRLNTDPDIVRKLSIITDRRNASHVTEELIYAKQEYYNSSASRQSEKQDAKSNLDKSLSKAFNIISEIGIKNLDGDVKKEIINIAKEMKGKNIGFADNSISSNVDNFAKLNIKDGQYVKN